MKDYYAMLGVSRDATTEEINSAFHKLAHKYHPDKKTGNTEKFKEVNEAYQVLKDKNKRAQHDMGGGAGGNFNGSDFNGAGFDFNGAGFDFNGMGFDFQDIFKEASRQMRRGQDIQMDVPLSFKEAVLGTSKRITVPYRGKDKETFSIEVPVGVESGTRLRLTGRGEPSKQGNAPAGDLYIRIVVNPDSRFETRNGDLITHLDLTPSEAILGVERKVVDIHGDNLNILIPPLSKDGSHIIIKGKGIPYPNGNDRLIVICRVVYPRKISKKAKKLLEELREEGV